jgi:LCP family protein required for cell wall assembly
MNDSFEPNSAPEPVLTPAPGTPPQKRRPRWVIFFVAVVALAALAFALGHLRDSNDSGITLLPRHEGFLYRVKNFFFPSNDTLEGQQSDRINILLLGIGGLGHEGPYLSDTNIIVSIKPSTKQVALIPVPRDLAADVPGHGVRKINSANAFGEGDNPGHGGEFASQVFSKIFNTPLPYYIRVDFQAFKDIIDALGGVSVNVPRTFTDTQFPGENFSFRTVHFDAGTQTMDGATALDYARSRHGDNGEGSDFARGKRQELILSAVKEKALSLSTLLHPDRLQAIFNSLRSHVTTNLSFDQLVYLAGLSQDVQLPAKTVVLDSSPTGYLINTTGEDGAFLLSPKSGSFEQINKAISDVFVATTTAGLAVNEPTPAATYVTTPSVFSTTTKIEIQNGTWRAGLAARVGQELNSQGLTIIRVGNSIKRPIDTTTIYVRNINTPKNTITALTSLLHAPFATKLPDWLSESYDNPSTAENEQGMKYNTSADVIIILGSDTKP